MPERLIEMITAGFLGGFTRWVMTVSHHRPLNESLCFLIKSIIAGVFLATITAYADASIKVFPDHDLAIAVSAILGFTWQIVMPLIDRIVSKKTAKIEDSQ